MDLYLQVKGGDEPQFWAVEDGAIPKGAPRFCVSGVASAKQWRVTAAKGSHVSAADKVKSGYTFVGIVSLDLLWHLCGLDGAKPLLHLEDEIISFHYYYLARLPDASRLAPSRLMERVRMLHKACATSADEALIARSTPLAYTAW